MGDFFGKAAALAEVGKILSQLSPLAIGAGIALRFSMAEMTPRAKLCAVATSFALGHYIGGAVVEWFSVGPGYIADAIKIAAAMYGLSATSSINAELPAAIAAIRRKLTGDQK